MAKAAAFIVSKVLLSALASLALVLRIISFSDQENLNRKMVREEHKGVGNDWQRGE